MLQFHDLIAQVGECTARARVSLIKEFKTYENEFGEVPDEFIFQDVSTSFSEDFPVDKDLMQSIHNNEDISFIVEAKKKNTQKALQRFVNMVEEAKLRVCNMALELEQDSSNQELSKLDDWLTKMQMDPHNVPTTPYSFRKRVLSKHKANLEPEQPQQDTPIKPILKKYRQEDDKEESEIFLSSIPSTLGASLGSVLLAQKPERPTVVPASLLDLDEEMFDEYSPYHPQRLEKPQKLPGNPLPKTKSENFHSTSPHKKEFKQLALLKAKMEQKKANKAVPKGKDFFPESASWSSVQKYFDLGHPKMQLPLQTSNKAYGSHTVMKTSKSTNSQPKVLHNKGINSLKVPSATKRPTPPSQT